MRFAGLGTAIVTVAFAGGACSHDPPPPAATPPATAAPVACATPEPLRVSVAASSRLNPGEKGEALATVVRLYQLKNINRLMGVSFDDLLDRDKEALGDDLLGMQEVTINPGDRIEPTLPRGPETGYLLAVALFRQPAGTTWKVVRKLSPPDPNHCHNARGAGANSNAPRFFLDENRIELR